MPTADWSILGKPRRQTFINPPFCLLQQRQEPSDWVPYILGDLWKENIINALSFPHDGRMDDEGTKKQCFDILAKCWEMVWKPFHAVWMYKGVCVRVCALKRFYKAKQKWFAKEMFWLNVLIGSYTERKRTKTTLIKQMFKTLFVENKASLRADIAT